MQQAFRSPRPPSATGRNPPHPRNSVSLRRSFTSPAPPRPVPDPVVVFYSCFFACLLPRPTLPWTQEPAATPTAASGKAFRFGHRPEFQAEFQGAKKVVFLTHSWWDNGV